MHLRSTLEFNNSCVWDRGEFPYVYCQSTDVGLRWLNYPDACLIGPNAFDVSCYNNLKPIVPWTWLALKSNEMAQFFTVYGLLKTVTMLGSTCLMCSILDRSLILSNDLNTKSLKSNRDQACVEPGNKEKENSVWRCVRDWRSSNKHCHPQTSWGREDTEKTTLSTRRFLSRATGPRLAMRTGWLIARGERSMPNNSRRLQTKTH